MKTKIDNIEILSGDITSLDVDIIVNAANKTLLGGAGVDGAIHYKAGPELLEECKTLNGCETGEAKITKAYKLPCKRIIHTVGPMFHSNPDKAPQLLKNCYLNSMKLAEQYRMENNLSTFITSNLNIDELETHLSLAKNNMDKVKARRIIERIKQITIDSELISKNRRN